MFREAIPPDTVREVRDRAVGCCENCGVKPTLFRKLEMHHLRYETWDHRGPAGCIFGKETANDLRLLCHVCHRAAHRDPNGEYWRDVEDMESNWQAFHEAAETSLDAAPNPSTFYHSIKHDGSI